MTALRFCRRYHTKKQNATAKVCGMTVTSTMTSVRSAIFFLGCSMVSTDVDGAEEDADEDVGDGVMKIVVGASVI